MVYMVWKVFEEEKRARFYVINLKTKRIQSSWHLLVLATKACNDLNRKVG